jgi:hypothetical protein
MTYDGCMNLKDFLAKNSNLKVNIKTGLIFRKTSKERSFTTSSNASGFATQWESSTRTSSWRTW